MNNSNSYNVCTRCGTPNSLSAKYCYQCGGQLKVPEQPIVCAKCNTVNTGIANFCRNCGATLKIGALTKKCPRCSKEVEQENSQCSCGYSFAQNGAPVRAKDSPSDPVDVRTGKKIDVVETSVKKTGRAAGRVFGFFSLLIALAVAVLYLLPDAYRPTFMSSLFLIGASANINLYAIIQTAMAGGFANFSLGEMITYGTAAFMIVCVAIHALVALISLIFGCRPKHANWLYLVFAVLSALALALVVCASTSAVVSKLAFLSMFSFPAGQSFGLLTYAVPAYFLLMFLLSFISKRKKAKTV